MNADPEARTGDTEIQNYTINFGPSIRPRMACCAW